MSTPTVKIGATDLGTYAYITDWSSILQAPPTKGDVIELDFAAGAVWQKGEAETYTFDVPLVMKSQDPATAVGQAMTIQTLCNGTEVAIRREFYSGTTWTMQTCQGVISQAIPLDWDLGVRSKVGMVLIVQNLSGTWTSTT